MLSIQAVRGLPHLRAPAIVPCIISFSRQLPCFIMVWPQYASFIASAVFNSSLFTPALLRTHSFVFYAVSVFLRPFISKASKRVSSFFLSIQLSCTEREDTTLSDPFLNKKPFWKCSRYFDLSELFPVQFSQQVNQVQRISHVHHSHPELIWEIESNAFLKSTKHI